MIGMTGDAPFDEQNLDYDSLFTGMDARAVLYLIIVARDSPIIQDFILNLRGHDDLSSLFRTAYLKLEVAEKREVLCDALNAAYEDYAWINIIGQDCLTDAYITEQSFYKKATSEHICDKCKGQICQGDSFYRRTIVYPAIRHEKCNKNIRCTSEYSHIDIIVRTTRAVRAVFAQQDYSLPRVPSELVRTLMKQKYEINDNLITAFPNMGDFIMDYISGVDDFILVRKYIPYLSYLVCFLHMRNIPLEEIKQIGADILLLRSDDKKTEKWSHIKNILYSTGYVDIRCGRYGEIATEKEIKDLMAREILLHLFSISGLLDKETGCVTVEGEKRSYSFGEENSGADINIAIGENGAILCSDNKTCKDICDYFGLTDPVSTNMVRYMVSVLR